MRWLEMGHATGPVRRALGKAGFGLVMLGCIGWSAVQASWPAGHRAGVPAANAVAGAIAPEWPAQWAGRILRPLALGEVEQRFAAQFPGALARLTDGRRVLVLRHVTAPTRMLHPAADCYRALGYRIAAARLEHDAEQRLWRCFEAHKSGGRALRVCERIVDADGRAFTDTSAWYWAAAAGQSTGPWQATTVAEAL